MDFFRKTPVGIYGKSPIQSIGTIRTIISQQISGGTTDIVYWNTFTIILERRRVHVFPVANSEFL